jgi:hypothetical protein
MLIIRHICFKGMDDFTQNHYTDISHMTFARQHRRTYEQQGYLPVLVATTNTSLPKPEPVPRRRVGSAYGRTNPQSVLACFTHEVLSLFEGST